jgi:hypothetical protein
MSVGSKPSERRRERTENVSTHARRGRRRDRIADRTTQRRSPVPPTGRGGALREQNVENIEVDIGSARSAKVSLATAGECAGSPVQSPFNARGNPRDRRE